MKLEQRRNKPLKVLVIDDEVDICLLLTSILKKSGHETLYSTTIKQGVVAMDQFEPDIVFLDLNLSDGSGFAAIPLIRESNPMVEIVIISAHDGPFEKKRALNENIEFFLNKPLKKSEIDEVLDQLSEKSQTN